MRATSILLGRKMKPDDYQLNVEESKVFGGMVAMLILSLFLPYNNIYSFIGHLAVNT